MHLNNDKLDLAPLRPTHKTESVYVPIFYQRAEQQFAYYVPRRPAGGV